ncbi:MAG: hypothetical protein ACYDH5_19950, partial [Acidimicrobiales bacterium]
AELLSPHGVRSVSRSHREHPFVLPVAQDAGQVRSVDYEPAESTSGLFGGNSNWRGPVWFPVNYLLIEALRRFDWYLGDAYEVEVPTGSGQRVSLAEAAGAISSRLVALFTDDGTGRRPVFGDAGGQRAVDVWRAGGAWYDRVLFYEYFHGDTGRGLGASHQTGWTGLVADLIAPASTVSTLASPQQARQGPDVPEEQEAGCTAGVAKLVKLLGGP